MTTLEYLTMIHNLNPESLPTQSLESAHRFPNAWVKVTYTKYIRYTPSLEKWEVKEVKQ